MGLNPMYLNHRSSRRKQFVRRGRSRGASWHCPRLQMGRSAAVCEAPAAARWKTLRHEVNSSRPVSRSCCGWSATQSALRGQCQDAPLSLQLQHESTKKGGQLESSPVRVHDGCAAGEGKRAVTLAPLPSARCLKFRSRTFAAASAMAHEVEVNWKRWQPQLLVP